MHPEFLKFRSAVFTGLMLLASVPSRIPAESVVFPGNCGIVDVTKSPYSINNHGTVDVTTQLRNAIHANMNKWITIYFPNGTYLVSDSLLTGTCNGICDGSAGSTGPVLQGQSRKGTVIRLHDGTWPLGTEKKAVLHLGDGIAQNFRRGVHNLTVNIGSNNAGAWGIYYVANNEGLISDLDIISEDGKGLVGLNLGIGTEQGPCMVRDVFIKGFQQGVYSDALNSVTVLRLSLQGQTQYGVNCFRHMLWIDSLTSINTVPAVWVQGSASFLVDNARLTGGSGANPAIKNDGGAVFVRHVTAQGYSRAIACTGTPVAAPSGMAVDEYGSRNAVTLLGSPLRSMDLPVRYPPEPAWEPDTAKWANIQNYKGGFGSNPRSDQAAFQMAIDAPGKTTVVIPWSRQYTIDDTLRVRGAISRIIGSPAKLAGNGVILIEDGTAPVVKLHRIQSVNVINRSHRTVIIEQWPGGTIYADGAGDLFLSDVIPELNVTGAQQKVFAWQFDAECCQPPYDPNGLFNLNVYNGVVRIFGWKNENTQTKMHAFGGALEIVGMEEYNCSVVSNQATCPLAVISNCQFSFAFLTQVNFTTQYFTFLVKQTKGNQTVELHDNNCPGGVNIPLYTGYDSAFVQTLARPLETHAPERIMPAQRMAVFLARDRVAPADMRAAYDIHGRRMQSAALAAGKASGILILRPIMDRN